MKKDSWKPPRVYRGRSAWEYHPSSGGNIRLCDFSASPADVWIAYEKVKENNKDKKTISYLIEGYLSSEHFLYDLSPSTQQDYRDCEKKISKSFGHMKAQDLQPKHIRKYMDLRSKTSKHRANRERVFLSNVMSWGFERGLAMINPCKGVKPFKQNKRDRYVEDWEYQAAYDIAPPNIQTAMEVAYLCASRLGDVRLMKLKDLFTIGLYIKQGKTGKKQIKKWTPRLKNAIKTSVKQPSQIKTRHIIHNRKGQPYSDKGLKGMMGKIVDKAMGICRRKKSETDEQYLKRKIAFDKKYPPIVKTRFSFHDLKAKGMSDFEGDVRKFSGHATEAMANTYNRTADIVDILEPEKRTMLKQLKFDET